MKKDTPVKTHVIDAEGQRIGRVASLAAMFLMGKHAPTFERNKITGVKVSIVNASKADVNQARMAQKTYARYSGYPGGLKMQKAKDVIARHGYRDIFAKAIYGMIPSNRLRAIRMKNLTIAE
ncbi:MAG: 50S ribosomal protein L13 [Parcubacteria group bacterium]|nr:50S ribosomal protein L13 [Parcubacteria group bacterium]